MIRINAVIMLLAAMLFFSPAIMAESEHSAKTADKQAAMEEYMKLAGPGEEHDMLAELEGRWKMSGMYWLMPGTEPVSFTGSAFNEMTLGGRFLQMTSESGEGEMYTETLGLLGFDRRHRKFTYIGLDTWGTYYITASGEYDDSTKTITMYGEDVDPVAGFTQKYDQIMRIIDGDKFVFEVIFYNKELTDGADSFKMVEITYTRVK